LDLLLGFVFTVPDPMTKRCSLPAGGDALGHFSYRTHTIACDPRIGGKYST